MSRSFGAMALTLAILVVAGNVKADDEDSEEVKKAQKDVLELVKKITNGAKDVSTDAAKIAKKYEDLNTVMHVYKPSRNGGIGYGKPAVGDGIELKIIDLGKRATDAAVKAQKKELLRLANINLAMVEIAKQYAPSKPKAGKGAKDWNLHAADMKKATLELIEAIKEGKGAKVKAAANNLNASCNNCHGDFRDNP